MKHNAIQSQCFSKCHDVLPNPALGPGDFDWPYNLTYYKIKND